MMQTATLEQQKAVGSRLVSIDVLRGLVMVIMALDHSRDFLSSALFDATDLTRTTPLLFFTRWITHFCAPIFVWLAGTGAYLSIANGSRDRYQLARFLFTRGLWLLFLEVAVIAPLGWSFSLGFGFTRLQVIWVIGASMVIMAGLVAVFSARAIGIFGLVVIALQNMFDGAHVKWLGRWAGVWRAVHNPNFYEPFPHKVVGLLYPVLPWLAVMAVGYGMGHLALLEGEKRKRTFLKIGLAALALFCVIRMTNAYGEPQPWHAQSDAVRTLMSFVNCTKYPPSLLYLLMTLGGGLCFLACADALPTMLTKPLAVFGRVPLFYYLLHLPILHGLAVAFSFARYGRAEWLYQDSFALRGSTHPLPAGYGYDLWVVYLVWAAVVLLLYQACRWFGEVKSRNRSTVLSYL